MNPPMQPNGQAYGQQPPWPHYYPSPAGVSPLPQNRGKLYRFFPDHSLQPSYLGAHGISSLVGIVLTAVKWREHNWQNSDENYTKEPGNYIHLLLVASILFTIFLVIEVVAFGAGFMPNAKLIKLFTLIAPISFALSLVSQSLTLASTFKYRSFIRSQCEREDLAANESGDSRQNSARYSWGGYDCDSRWEGLAAWDVVWLVVLVILGLFFCYVTYRFQSVLTQTERSNAQPHAPFMGGAPQDMQLDQTYPMNEMSTRQSFDRMSADDEAFGDHKSDFGNADTNSFVNEPLPSPTADSFGPRHEAPGTKV